MPDRVAFAPISRIAHEMESRICSVPVLNQPRSTIKRAVINYQHLGLQSLAGMIEKGSETAESFGQSGPFVVSRYDNRERGQITVYLLAVRDACRITPNQILTLPF